MPQARRPLARLESSNGNTLKLRTSSGLIRRGADEAPLLFLAWAWAYRDTEASRGIVGCVRHRGDFIHPQVSAARMHALRLLVAESDCRWAIAKHGGGLLCFREADSSGRASQEETDLDDYCQAADCEDCKGIPGEEGVPFFLFLKRPINRLVSACWYLGPVCGWCLPVAIDSASRRRQ